MAGLGLATTLGLGSVSLWAVVPSRSLGLVLVPWADRARHYWSPALVGFIGFGGGGGSWFGFGNVGWVPLAPYEVFHPWWGRGYYGNRGFNRNINITNVNVTNVYRNSRVRNGISAVAADDFQSGRFTALSRTSGDRIQDVGAIRGPCRSPAAAANQRFSDRQATVIPRGTENTRFFRISSPIRCSAAGFGNAIRPLVSRRAAEKTGSAAAGQPDRRIAGRRARITADGGDSVRRRQQPAGGQGSQQPQVNRGGQQFGTGQAQRNDRPAVRIRRLTSRRLRATTIVAGGRGLAHRGGGNVPEQRQQTPAAPRQEYRANPSSDRPSYGSGNSNRQESLRITPPVVRERPSYNDNRRQQSAP